MATFWKIAAHSVDHVFSFVFGLIVILVISHFGFEGCIWVLIASIPDLCMLHTSSSSSKTILNDCMPYVSNSHYSQNYVSSNL